MSVRVLVCGGLRFAGCQRLYAALDDIAEREGGISALICGGMVGAAEIARAWAAERGVQQLPLSERGMGIVTARQVFDARRPDIFLACGDDISTTRTAEHARLAGVRVEEIGS